MDDPTPSHCPLAQQTMMLTETGPWLPSSPFGVDVRRRVLASTSQKLGISLPRRHLESDLRKQVLLKNLVNDLAAANAASELQVTRDVEELPVGSLDVHMSESTLFEDYYPICEGEACDMMEEESFLGLDKLGGAAAAHELLSDTIFAADVDHEPHGADADDELILATAAGSLRKLMGTPSPASVWPEQLVPDPAYSDPDSNPLADARSDMDPMHTDGHPLGDSEPLVEALAHANAQRIVSSRTRARSPLHGGQLSSKSCPLLHEIIHAPAAADALASLADIDMQECVVLVALVAVGMDGTAVAHEPILCSGGLALACEPPWDVSKGHDDVFVGGPRALVCPLDTPQLVPCGM